MLAPLEVPPMQHITEMRTPAPEVVLAEFWAQKGVAGSPTDPAAAPETIAEEPAAEAEDGAISPRSGGTLCAHKLTCQMRLEPSSISGSQRRAPLCAARHLAGPF